MNRCRGVGGDASRSGRRWLICNQSAPVCTITRMTSAALEEGWEAWAVPSPIRTHSAPSWTPISTFTRFPTGSRRSRPAPWKTASSRHPWARCHRAFTASQTVTSSWGEGNPSEPIRGQDKWVPMFYTQGQTFPMLLLTKSYFSTFPPPLFFLVVCNIKSILRKRWRTLRRTASVDTMECKAWSMDVYFFKRLLHLHKLQDLPYVRFTVQNWYINFGFIPNDAHLGRCYFSKGSMLVSP